MNDINQYYKIYLQINPKSNHFYVNAFVNGHAVSLIVDTGASATCFDTSRAEDWDLDMEESEEKAAGIGTTNATKFDVKIDDFKLGNILFKGYKAAAINLEQVNLALEQKELPRMDGILGGDFFVKYNAIINYERHCMLLKKNACVS